jgi:hypothetical protein
MAKRRNPPLPVQPLLITKGPWIRAEFKPPQVGHDRSDIKLVYNGSCGRSKHIAWFDFDRGEWRNNYGTIENVTHWMDLPPDPQREVIA